MQTTIDRPWTSAKLNAKRRTHGKKVGWSQCEQIILEFKPAGASLRDELSGELTRFL
ncbi:hypothetical protein KIN20_013398 [Parelaphostrongylus tenuis]|uniref:Uncharacterized protein n=1 Tax=Parelaphostrongylus tenuis TaxID=148309 RepID=A0AAD5QQZ3_PARTN|nr:hypothetical protein KIN20_013398 [Parelaphostrongylus tenuis]